MVDLKWVAQPLNLTSGSQLLFVQKHLSSNFGCCSNFVTPLELKYSWGTTPLLLCSVFCPMLLCWVQCCLDSVCEGYRECTHLGNLPHPYLPQHSPNLSVLILMNWGATWATRQYSGNKLYANFCEVYMIYWQYWY